MLNFNKEKVNIADKLKQRIDFICKFCGFNPVFEFWNMEYNVNDTIRIYIKTK